MNKIFEQAVTMMNGISAAAGEGYAYAFTWGNDFRCSEINNTFENYKNKTNEFFWRAVFDLSVDEKIILGFRAMDDECRKNNKLNIPIWIWNLLCGC